MALDAFRAAGSHMQGTATQAMLNASLRSRNGADGCPPPKPFEQPPLAARQRSLLGQAPVLPGKTEK